MPHTTAGGALSFGSRTLPSTFERGLTLSVDPDFRLPPLSGTPLPRTLQISTYYDTVSHDLAHARITLRRRVERGKKSWQLRLPLCENRQTVEIVDPGERPPAALLDLLVLYLGQRQPAPVATLRVWRTGIRVRRGRRPVTEIALDHVSVVKNGLVIQKFREIIIERWGAGDRMARELEDRLRFAGARDHDGRPKLFRALSLPAPAPDRPPDRDAPVADHVKWALAQHVRRLRAHDPGTRLGAESESLHQMRVATRRLRAVLRAAEPVLDPEWTRSLENELSWLGAFLGQARDLDVQIAYFEQEATRLDARDQQRLTQFLAYLRTQRARVQELVLSELTSARYFDFVRRLQQAAGDPLVVDTAVTLRDLAGREFKKLRKVIRNLGSSPKQAAIHTLRIKTKRARYAAELAMRAVGKPAVRFMKRAMAVQNLLGDYQDSFIAETYIRAFLKHSTGVRAGFTAGRMVERQHHRRADVLTQAKPKLRSLLKWGKRAWA